MADAQSQAAEVVQAVERLTHNVLRSLVEAVKCATNEAGVLLVEPRHSLIQAPRQKKTSYIEL